MRRTGPDKCTAWYSQVGTWSGEAYQCGDTYASAPFTASSQEDFTEGSPNDVPPASPASALPRATWNDTQGVPSLRYSRQNGSEDATGLRPSCAQTTPKPRASAKARLVARSGS